MREKWKAILLIAVAAAGCQTPPQRATVALSTAPILLVPPVASRPEAARSAGRLGDFLHVALARRLGGNVIDARHVPALRPLLTQENLAPNGVYDLGEIAAMVKASGCAGAALCLLQDESQQPPQRLALGLTWLRAGAAATVRTTFLEIDLKDPITRRNYVGFVHDDKDSDRWPTARLSPDYFRRFAADEAAQNLALLHSGR